MDKLMRGNAMGSLVGVDATQATPDPLMAILGGFGLPQFSRFVHVSIALRAVNGGVLIATDRNGCLLGAVDSKQISQLLSRARVVSLGLTGKFLNQPTTREGLVRGEFVG